MHTPKLGDTRNQPLRVPDYHSHKYSNRLLLRHITQLLLKKISRFSCLGDVIVVNTTERKPWELNGKCKISFLLITKTLHLISATLETHTYALFFLFFSNSSWSIFYLCNVKESIHQTSHHEPVKTKGLPRCKNRLSGIDPVHSV